MIRRKKFIKYKWYVGHNLEYLVLIGRKENLEYLSDDEIIATSNKLEKLIDITDDIIAIEGLLIKTDKQDIVVKIKTLN